MFSTFAIVLFLTLSNTEVAADTEVGHQTDTAALLHDNLIEMSYEDISLEKCRLEFSRDMSDNTQTPFDRYTTVIHLDSLDFSHDVKVRRLNTVDIVHGFSIPTKQEYYPLYQQILRFNIWLRKNYPGMFWPHDMIEKGAADVSKVEQYIQENMNDLHMMNVYVYSGAFGNVTGFPGLHLGMTYFEKDKLVDFWRLFNRYANENDCT